MGAVSVEPSWREQARKISLRVYPKDHRQLPGWKDNRVRGEWSDCMNRDCNNSLLWNIGFNAALNTALHVGVHITFCADDTLMVACGKDWTRSIRVMEAGLTALTAIVAKLGFELSAQKQWRLGSTGFCGLPRTRRPSAVGHVHIPVGGYLGMVLDGRSNFEAHFAYLAPRLEKVALSLSRILPNIGGPKEKIRCIYAGLRIDGTVRRTNMGERKTSQGPQCYG